MLFFFCAIPIFHFFFLIFFKKDIYILKLTSVNIAFGSVCSMILAITSAGILSYPVVIAAPNWKEAFFYSNTIGSFLSYQKSI